jgi:3-isopropylmalate/(R)-2-methylmalate dehydratase small subunit
MAKVIAKLGDDVSTDVIYPGRYMATVLPTETPQFAFANDPEIHEKLESEELVPGSVIVAGKNFGCGSSREQAVSTLTGYGLTIVAEGISRIFLQNAINLGLNVVIAPGVQASEGDELEVAQGRVFNRATGRSYPVVPRPKSRQAILDAGGLIAYTRRRLLDEASTRA